MWPGKLETMGTVVANSSDPSAVELTIQFAKAECYTIVFPTEPLEYQPYPLCPQPNPSDQAKLDQMINAHSLKVLSKEGKDIIWKYRRSYCMRFPAALPKFLQSVPKTDRYFSFLFSPSFLSPSFLTFLSHLPFSLSLLFLKLSRIAIQEMHNLLEEWAPITPVAALELLDARFADQYVLSMIYIDSFFL